MTKSTMKHRRFVSHLAVATALATASLVGASLHASAENVTLKIAYSADYQMSTPDLAKQWFTEAKQNFEKANPGVTVELVPIPGSYDDLLTKLSLMFNNPSQAPDVAEVPAPELGGWVSSDLLLPLDDYLAKTTWWPQYVDSIKAESKVDGKYYAASNGVNTNALMIDKDLFAKASLSADWKAKNWNDILDAARAIKKSSPNASPLWVLSGTAGGTSTMVLGAENLIRGSIDPSYYDAKTGKWTVDSKGIREVLQFYKTAATEGLFAPASDMLNANGAGNAAGIIAKRGNAISMIGNYIPQIWNKVICGPCWPDSDKAMAVVPIPTSQGQAPGIVTALSGWDLAISKSSKHPDLAFKLLDSMYQKDSLLEVDNSSGFIPPIPAYNSEKTYVDFAPATQKIFADLAPNGAAPPSVAEYKVWSFALEQATEKIILHPDTSVDDAVNDIKSYVGNQIGDDKTEVRS